MKQFEKKANILAAISLAIFIISTAIYTVIDNTFVEKFRDINYFVFGGITFLIMVAKSDIWVNKSYRKFIAFQLLLFFIVVTFQITHLPLVIVLYICFSTLTILYFIYFIKKEKKQFLDTLKFLWFVSISILIVFKLLHYPFAMEIELSYLIVFWFMIVFYWVDWLKMKNIKI